MKGGSSMEKWKEGFENLKKINLKSIPFPLIFGIFMASSYVEFGLRKDGNSEAASLIQRTVFTILWAAVYLRIRFKKENKEVFKNKYSDAIFLCIILVVGLPIIILYLRS